MNLAVISKLTPLFEKVADLCKNVMNAGDSEKFAKSVLTFNQDVSEHCAEMRALVINDSEMSTENKLECLKAILELEQDAKYKSTKAIQENREHVAKVALVVTKAALTCGVSLAPEIVKSIKNTVNELPVANENDLLE